MKKVLSVIMVLALTLAFITTAYATEGQENDFKGYADLGDEQTVVSDVLTFDQLIDTIAKDENISKKEARNRVVGSYAKNNAKAKNLSEDQLLQLVAGSTYRTISSQFTVTSVYKPSLRFYCETSEGGGFWGIVRILNIGMNRSYDGITKQYGGTVYANLENAGRIFWIVNGDFYNNGTTTVSGGVNIGIDESATVSFNVGYSSNHYAYCYKEGSYNIK